MRHLGTQVLRTTRLVLRPFSPEDAGVSAVEIGYCIGAAWWRRGYTSEALSEVIRFFMEEVGANRVSARHDPENPNSGRVMRHCNMLCEGMLRQAGRNN